MFPRDLEEGATVMFAVDRNFPRADVDMIAKPLGRLQQPHPRLYRADGGSDRPHSPANSQSIFERVGKRRHTRWLKLYYR